MGSVLNRFRPRSFVKRILPAAICMGLACAKSYGAADPTDVVQLNLSATLSKDNNLYRIPDVDPRLFGVDPAKNSDTIERLGVRLLIDKTVSRQHFLVDAGADQNNYRKNDNLDHTASDASARWLWQVGNPWNGEISYRYQHYLSGFADVSARVVNLVTVEQYTFEGGYRLHPRWRLWAGLNEVQVSNSAPSQVGVNTDITTALLGVEYQTPSDNKAGIQVRFAEGTFPNQGVTLINNDYKDIEPSLIWNWQTSAKTRFYGRLGYLQRHQDVLPSRDFSGLTGRADVTWELAGKTQIKATGWRELWTYQSQTSSYALVSGVEVVPSWAVTSKLLLQAKGSYETRDYLGDPGFVIGVPTRTDEYRLLRLAVVYTPIRNVETSLMLEKSSRESNRPLNDFHDKTSFISLKLSF